MHVHKLAALLLLSTLASAALAAAALLDDAPADLKKLDQLHADGNYQQAYDGFRRLALAADTDRDVVAHCFEKALHCLQQLGRVDEIDAFREQLVERHPDNWRLLRKVADSYLNVEHHGHLVAGKFERGNRRGGGEVVNAAARDRVRALQLLLRAKPSADQEDALSQSEWHTTLAAALLSGRGAAEAWRFQYKSNLDELPDYEPGWYYDHHTTGAPVGADGQPLYYTTPASFEAAVNDGQRWRWALARAMEIAPERTPEVRWQLATFWQSQFGVQTLASFGRWFGALADEQQEADSGTYALHTLSDEETIARLAGGVRRFKLPDEFNYLKIYEQIAAESPASYAQIATDALAGEFENRRQYPRAAESWRRAIQSYGPGGNNYRQARWQQIVGNWGRFEGTATQAAGQPATLDFRFRNGRKVHFVAQEINVEKLLADVKAYLRAEPKQLDWNRLNVADLGYRLIEQGERQYVGRRVADWDQELEPRGQHFDGRIAVKTPLTSAGAYLLTATMADGNTSHIVLWLADTAIVKKPLAGKTYYYVCDAVSGQPVPQAQLEFFGYRQRQTQRNRFRVDTVAYTAATDAQGQATPEATDERAQFSWLITARTAAGRLAYLGFTGVWKASYGDEQYSQTKVFTITDRPVYRPDQTVQYKFWVREAQYDREGSRYAGQNFNVQILNPRGDKVLEQPVTADDYGGITGEYRLPPEADLGVYQLVVEGHGGGTFRVEEYKKPEFAVTVEGPKKPLMLGETIHATINARYYFGAPVTQATVKYKVLRAAHHSEWYPVGAWDWLYGSGYWWFAYDCAWHPGWRAWGCRAPLRWWWPRQQDPPEIVAEAEMPIGPDGQVLVSIDTAAAKAMHADQDHQYTITAEVVDQSRRTIVGTGNVLVARRPFSVFAWVDRGFYRTGDTIRASFAAHTLDRQPVAGKGKLSLLRIRYDERREPHEDLVREWDLDTDAQGQAQQTLEASQAGQYRLAYRLTDADGHAAEGGYLFTVRGEGFTGAAFRFNHLELIPEVREYRPGQQARLMINTDRADGTVLLFLRPVGGVYLPPRVVRMTGKSTVVEIDVAQRDMPNFFVEAVTVADGRVHTELKEIVVPPESRVVNVAVEASSREFKPGQQAEVKLRLTDFFGQPFVGSTVLAVYDKSLEYISGGSNVPEIREFFWKWRRTHYPQTESSLLRDSRNFAPPGGSPTMGDLGLFGGTVVDELSRDGYAFGDRRERSGRREFGMALNKRGDLAGAVAESAAAFAADGGASGEDKQLPGAGSVPTVEPAVRSNFADTALWVGALTTAADGTASVKFTMPESLTTWRVKAWAVGAGTRVGQGDVDVITKKNLIVRMQAPRFFVEKDEVVLSAIVHNYLASRKSVQVVLECDGATLRPLASATRAIEVEPGGEVRVDWRVAVAAEGQAVVRMKALTDEESDAVEMRFPAYVHGMLKTDAVAGALRPDEAAGQFTVRVPRERRPAQSRLEIRYSPTLAGALVDALPYLVEYPYGCTEQTLNRFLPTVITQRVLVEMKLNLQEIRDKRANLNAQEIGDPAERAARWKQFERNPVFDEDEVRRMARHGVQALADMQLADGGWGWFSGFGEQSWPHTTATVVHGLQVAQAAGTQVPPDMLARGVAWLTQYQETQVRHLVAHDRDQTKGKPQADALDALVYQVLIDAGVAGDAMRDFLYRDRTALPVYAKALFGLALEKQGDQQRLVTILQNVSQFVVQDNENQTAYLRMPEGNAWWYWHGSDVEAMACYLKLLARTEPRGAVAARLAKYLLNNRRHATYWNSTRDTALCVEALAEFWRASGESAPDMTVEVWIDGQKRQETRITPENLFTIDNSFVLEGAAVEEGQHAIELRKAGQGPLYYNAYLTNFTLEDPIAPAGLEVKIDRKFYRLVAVDKQSLVAGDLGQAVNQRVEKYERHEIENLGTLKSGDLVEVELAIDSKNDYEYLLFEDLKPAGFEPVEVRSGYGAGGLGAYVEYRDNRVAFFVRSLARGRHSVSYRMRAETPGRFSALPARASAMYAPELRANSAEFKVQVADAAAR